MDKEIKKCSNCGAEIPDYVDRCPECGVKQMSHIQPRTGYNSQDEMPKIDKGEYILLKRHPFITVWLWLSIFVNFLAVLLFVALSFSSRGLFTATPIPLTWNLAGALFSIAYLVGLALLLRGKKLGFSILFAFSMLLLFGTVIVCLEYGFTVWVISPITSLAILYAVLQLKMNGISYWKTLK